jgi:hypothetical protein
VGGASLEDLAHGIARRFPDLPPLPRTTAPVDPLRRSFDGLWSKLQAGHCAVLDGNPAKVSEPKSPLRSMQGNDDYDTPSSSTPHGVSGSSSWTPSGGAANQGQWVPKADLRQFAARFATSWGSPYFAVVKRGQESRVERVRRATREQTRSLRTELATARAQALRDAARAIAALPR